MVGVSAAVAAGGAPSAAHCPARGGGRVRGGHVSETVGWPRRAPRHGRGRGAGVLCVQRRRPTRQPAAARKERVYAAAPHSVPTMLHAPPPAALPTAQCGGGDRQVAGSFQTRPKLAPPPTSATHRIEESCGWWEPPGDTTRLAGWTPRIASLPPAPTHGALPRRGRRSDRHGGGDPKIEPHRRPSAFRVSGRDACRAHMWLCRGGGRGVTRRGLCCSVKREALN